MKPFDRSSSSFQAGNSSINFHFSETTCTTGGSINSNSDILRSHKIEASKCNLSNDGKQTRTRVPVFPSSRSDYNLFTGRKPRPLSLPPGRLTSYNWALTHNKNNNNYCGTSINDVDNHHYQYLCTEVDNLEKKLQSSLLFPQIDCDNNNVNFISSAYRRKFPISYSTPGLSSIDQSMKYGDTSTSPYAVAVNINGSNSSTNSLGCPQEGVKNGNRYGKLPGSGIGLQKSEKLYKSTKCPRYSFHGLPIDNNIPTPTPNGNGSTESDQSIHVKRRSRLSLSLSDYKFEPSSTTGYLQRCGSLRVQKPSKLINPNYCGLTTSKSFTNGSETDNIDENWDDLSNTLPRSGRPKSNEHLTLFFDILSTQEKFVKVGQLYIS